MRRGTLARGALAAVITVTLAACIPPTTGTPVPSDYPPCLGSPTCLVIRSGATAAVTPYPHAISDDGRTMVTTKIGKVDEGLYRSTVALVGIDDRWYRQVAVTEPGSTIAPGDVAMTPDARWVVFVARALTSPSFPPAPASPSQLFLYDRTTKQLTKPEQPDWFGNPEISDDGRFVVGNGPLGITLLDLQAGTHQAVGSGYDPDISGDGRYVAWSSLPGDDGSSVGGTVTRYDRTDESTVVLPGRSLEPKLSQDGSRISSHHNPDGCCGGRQRVRYLDVGDADWTTVDDGGGGGQTWLSADGDHLVYYLADGVNDPGQSYDVNLTSGATRAFGPFSTPFAVAPNGDHVLYFSPLGVVRWSR